MVIVAEFSPIGRQNRKPAMFISTIWAAYSGTPIQPDMMVIISKAHHSMAIMSADGIPMDKN